MPFTYPTLPGDLDHLIADDHAVVNRLFQHLEEGRGNRRILADQVVFNLALHADAEERSFYPAMREVGMSDENAEAIEEHQKAKAFAAVVTKSEAGSTEFEQALTALISEIRHHAFEEEEARDLPTLRGKVGPARMAELGGVYLHAKRSSPSYAHPHAPTSKIGHALADPLALVADKIRDRMSGRRHSLATDASGLLDEQAQALLDAFSGLDPLPIENLTPDLARQQPGPDAAVRALLKQQGKSTDPEPVGHVQDLQISGAAGNPMTIRIYTPAGAGPFPVLLWIHGGGWVLYDIDTYDASCRGLCNKTGAVVVSPDYRKAPEHVFPASHDDVLATWQWMLGHIGKHKGDPSAMAIGGESVGATMAAATSMQLREQGLSLPRAQVLVYPLVTGEQDSDSFLDAADAHPLNRPTVSWMAMHAFKGVPDGAKDPRVDLLGLPETDLANFPPTLVITDERDPLRSQGERFADRLSGAGLHGTNLRYSGVMHEFFGAAAVLDKAAQAQAEVAQYLLTHLGQVDADRVIVLDTKQDARR